jgi:uncharacterized protein YoxC
MDNLVKRVRALLGDTKEEQKTINEAADEIERLREALRDLLDEQNGPPLVRRADEWQAAVDQARATLGEDK